VVYTPQGVPVMTSTGTDTVPSPSTERAIESLSPVDLKKLAEQLISNRSGSDLSKSESKRLEKKLIRTGGAIMNFPSRDSICGVISELPAENASYLYTKVFGYCPLIEIDSVEDILDTSQGLFIRMAMSLAITGIEQNLGVFAQDYAASMAYIKSTIDHAKSTTSETPFWEKTDEFKLYMFRFPLIREYTALLNGDETISEIVDADQYNYLGDTSLVIDGVEKLRGIINSEYGKKKDRPLKFPISLTQTESLNFCKIALTDSSIALMKYYTDFEYSRIIPIICVKKSVISSEGCVDF
jgi:hypothetical protein